MCIYQWFVILYCNAYCSEVACRQWPEKCFYTIICHVAMQGWSVPGPHLALCVPYLAFCPLHAVPCQLSVPCSTVPSFLSLAVPCQLSAPCSTVPSFLSLAVPYPAFCPLQYRVPSFLSLAVPYLAFCPLQYHILALFPGHYQILSRSCGEEFLNNCKIKSGVAWE